MSKLSKVLKNLSFIAILFTLLNCDSSYKNDDEIVIVASIPPLADFARHITGDRTTVVTLLPPGTNMHSYEPDPNTVKTIHESQIYFSLGRVSNFENILLNKIGKDKLNSLIDCSSAIEVVNNDPHYWLSPENARKIIELMYLEIVKLMPEHSLFFNNNKTRYISEIDSIDKMISEMLHLKRNKEILVFHPAWQYFADYYNINMQSIEKEGKQPKAADFKKTIELIRKKGIKCIFFDPHFDESSVQTIAAELNLNSDWINPLPNDYLNNLIDIYHKLDRHLQ
jgi:zinc transport system substrate-binding protein